MAAFAKTDLDMIGLARQDNQAAAMLFVLRDGKMIGRDVYLLEAAREATDDEVLASFLEQFYARATSIPREVYVPASVGESETIQAFLAERRGGPVHLRVPQRGEKRELQALATRNAEEHLAREHARWLADQGKTLAALEQLADALGLAGPPLRIECYDISQLPGRRVGRQHGRVRGRQAAERRVPALPDQDGRGPQRLRQPPGGPAPPVPAGPDGGGGQRGGPPLVDARPGHRRRRQAARSARPRRSSTSSGCTTCRWPAWPRSARSCSCPAARSPSSCPSTSSALYLVQRLRDEAHRFAITYHRSLRDKKAGPLGVRRPARRRAQAPPRAAQGVRVDQARARGPGRADRRGAGHRSRARRAHQGHARGLVRRVTGSLSCSIPPVCVEPVPSSSSSSACCPCSSSSCRACGSPIPRPPTASGG